MTTTWKIFIDWDRNGNFTSLYDDVTAYTTSANWFLGFRIPYVNVADNNKLELILNNSDRRFSPENLSSPLYSKIAPFRSVRIESFDGTITRVHWVGWVEYIAKKVQYGRPRMSIEKNWSENILQQWRKALPNNKVR
jgi:hypothetical protein